MPNKIAFNEDYPVITESDKLYERALPIMTPVTQTLAKGPGQYVNGVAPKYLKRGKGSHVWDVDGNEYLDYNMAIGPLSLGYAYPRVDEAIIAQLKDADGRILIPTTGAYASRMIRLAEEASRVPVPLPIGLTDTTDPDAVADALRS